MSILRSIGGAFYKSALIVPPRLVVSTLQVESDISILPLLTVQLLTPHHSISVSALIDSSSSGKCISQNLLRWLNLPCKWQDQELKIETIQGIVGASSTDLHPSFSKLDAFQPFPFCSEETHRRPHSGMPMALTTFPRSQMGVQRDPPMEWILFPELYLQHPSTPCLSFQSPD